MIQRLRFGVMAVFDLFNIFNGLNLDLHPRKKKKKTLLLMDKSNIEHNTPMDDIFFQLARDSQAIKL